MNLGQCSFEEIQAVADKIDGWLDPAETFLLYNTASKLKGEGAIVEIGSWCSKSLTYLVAGALKSKNKCKKFSIDPFTTSTGEPNGKYEIFIENLKKNELLDEIIHIKEKSQDAGKTFNEKIEFLFIDGFHKYDAVKSDFELFYPNLVENGYVAIHDVMNFEGPTILIKELAETNDTFKILDFVASTLIAQKVEKLTEEEKIHNSKIIESIYSIIKNYNVALV